MTLASPLLLLGLGLLFPVLLAFIVRRRQKILRVPSTVLWRKVALARSRTRRFRHLTRLLALLACLGAVLFLVVAAAEPTSTSRGIAVAIVVDVSASMGDGDSGAGPIEDAREVVKRLLAARGPHDLYTVIAAGPTPTCLAGPTDDPAALTQAADALAAERGEADIGAAVDLGAELVAGWSGARVIVVSDGGASIGAPARTAEGVTVVRHRVAGARDNVGITAFAARQPDDAMDGSEREVMIAVATSSTRARSAEVEVRANDTALARQRVQILPHEEAEVRIRVHVASAELVAHVRPTDGVDDALSLDDAASLVARPPLPPRALLVTSDAESAQAFFARAALQSAGVREVRPVAPNAAAHELAEGDVVVVLGEGEPTRLDAPTLYLGTATGALPFDAPHEVAPEDTGLRSVEERNALVRGVALDGLSVDRALAIDVPDGAHALVDLDGGTTVASGGAGRSSWVFVGIDPLQSDLVLRVAFPVLVANSLAVLRDADGVTLAVTVPRNEVEMRAAEEISDDDSAPVLDLGFSAPPSAWLAVLAALLLLFEAALFRKGWA